MVSIPVRERREKAQSLRRRPCDTEEETRLRQPQPKEPSEEEEERKDFPSESLQAV